MPPSASASPAATTGSTRAMASTGPTNSRRRPGSPLGALASPAKPHRVNRMNERRASIGSLGRVLGLSAGSDALRAAPSLEDCAATTDLCELKPLVSSEAGGFFVPRTRPVPFVYRRIGYDENEWSRSRARRGGRPVRPPPLRRGVGGLLEGPLSPALWQGAGTTRSDSLQKSSLPVAGQSDLGN